jgi:hypothetical protein
VLPRSRSFFPRAGIWFGVSRRKPDLPSGRDIEFLSVDLRDEEVARAAFEPLTDITHIAYTALHEKPQLVEQGTDRDQQRHAPQRGATGRAPPPISGTSVSCRERRSTRALAPIPIPARERDARKDHANFFFDHEDYVREMGAQHGFNYTALRPRPGGPSFVWEAADADLVADVMVWAALAPGGKRGVQHH